MNAQRAYELGLVSEVVPFNRLMTRAREIAEAILENSPLALRLTKQCIIDNIDKELNDAIGIGEYMRRENVGSKDMIEGMKAFSEKRKPILKGI